jgi:methionyl-tRNA synthetase
MRIYAVLSRPFIPDAAATIMASLGCDDWSWPEDARAALGVLAPGHGFTVPGVMFRKITDEEREGWETQFSGTRA